ncbi:MAG TPA: leucyl aminopeptidase [Pseudomonadales bacterium]|jgi:leucyl aminopeptidase|nr:leucyl aminopeptidase [Pseudomonadales bacterium]
MKYSTKSGKLEDLRTDCLIVTMHAARSVARALELDDYLAASSHDFVDKAGRAQLITLPKATSIRRLLVVGVGDDAELSPADYRKAIGAAATALKSAPVRDSVLAIDAFKVAGYDGYQKARVALASLTAQLYRFAASKQQQDETPPAQIAQLAVHSTARGHGATSSAVRHAQALDTGMAFARDLGNQPPNVCNPSYLAAEARKLARGASPKNRVRVKVIDEREIEKLGMGAFTSVTQGSATPGKLIIVEYRGAAAKMPPIALIGKGITFDTGGISLKPPAAMDEMKFDMCGAAAVLGTTKAVIDAKLPINLVTLVAAAENMPSGRASRPGDVVTTLSGQTVEILNTDAEGRLVLCDTLTYAERYRPKAVIDVATLTGACVVALGAHASGLFANDDALAASLLSAGEFIWDRAWQMPVWDDYQQNLKSNFADMANVGGRDAGAVVAACFLSRFAKQFAWAHLDVAGSAYASGAAKGSTGRPVPMLFQYLLNQA